MQQNLSTNLSYKSETNCHEVFNDHSFIYVLNDNMILPTALHGCFTALIPLLTFMTCLWRTEVLLSTQHRWRTEHWNTEVKDWQFKVCRYLASTSGVFSKEPKWGFILNFQSPTRPLCPPSGTYTLLCIVVDPQFCNKCLREERFEHFWVLVWHLNNPQLQADNAALVHNHVWEISSNSQWLTWGGHGSHRVSSKPQPGKKNH